MGEVCRNDGAQIPLEAASNTTGVLSQEGDFEDQQQPVRQDARQQRQGRRSNDAKDDVPLPPASKRRKENPPTRHPRRRISSSGASQPHQIRAPTSGQKHSERQSMHSPPASGDAIGTGAVPVAEYNEWPLEHAVLKRVMVNGLATFQIQFTWGPYVNCLRKSQEPEEPGPRPTALGDSSSLHTGLQLPRGRDIRFQHAKAETALHQVSKIRELSDGDARVDPLVSATRPRGAREERAPGQALDRAQSECELLQHRRPAAPELRTRS